MVWTHHSWMTCYELKECFEAENPFPGLVSMIGGEVPGTSVFTTLRWNGSSVAWLEEHLERLEAHAKRLSIEWPENMVEKIMLTEIDGNGNLCRIQLNRDGTIQLKLRESNYSASPLTAISQPAPRFLQAYQGAKHAAWGGYSTAREISMKAGADIALLVFEGVVVDGDHCTPIILDSDGVAFSPSLDGGGVDSITLAILEPAIEKAGIPFRRARLTENLLGRASELIVVGTGVGVAWLNEIDSQKIGSGTPGRLFEACKTAFESELENAWTNLR